MNVRDVMTKQVTPVRAEAPLSTAAQLMWDHDCGALPVCDGSDSQVVGMITDRDICMATWSRGSAPAEIRVSDAMSPKVTLCSPVDSIRSAEELMRSRRIRRIPVVDNQRHLVGIISLADIARVASRGDHSMDLSAQEVTSTLSSICQGPREARVAG